MIYLTNKYNGLCVVLYVMESPSLSASLNEKGPRKSVGLFHLIRRARSWFEPLVRQIRRERIWTRFSAARRASTMGGAGNPSL